jgi:hypothetical protein
MYTEHSTTEGTFKVYARKGTAAARESLGEVRSVYLLLWLHRSSSVHWDSATDAHSAGCVLYGDDIRYVLMAFLEEVVKLKQHNGKFLHCSFGATRLEIIEQLKYILF